MANRQKNLGFILGALIVLVGAAAFWYTREQTASPTDEETVYRNPDFGYVVHYPESWLMAEYPTAAGVTGVAFDPERVATAEELASLDKPPGRVWFSVSDQVLIDSVGMEPVALGPDNIQAYRDSYRCEPHTCPNPYWVGREDRRYYVSLPDRHEKNGQQLLTIVIDLAIEDVGDPVIEGEISRIVTSVTFD